MMGSPFINKQPRLREVTYPKLGNSWGSLPVRPVGSCHVHPLPSFLGKTRGWAVTVCSLEVNTSTHSLNWLCSLHLHL